MYTIILITYLFTFPLNQTLENILASPLAMATYLINPKNSLNKNKKSGDLVDSKKEKRFDVSIADKQKR